MGDKMNIQDYLDSGDIPETDDELYDLLDSDIEDEDEEDDEWDVWPYNAQKH